MWRKIFRHFEKCLAIPLNQAIPGILKKVGVGIIYKIQRCRPEKFSKTFQVSERCQKNFSSEIALNQATQERLKIQTICHNVT